MRKGKTGMALALVIALVLGMIPAPFLDVGILKGMFGALHVEAAASGTVQTTYGEIQWSFADDGTLTLTGDGTIDASTATKSGGWSAYRSQVKKIDFQHSGAIGQNAFGVPSKGGASPYGKLNSVELGDSVTSIEKEAFMSCSSLTSVTMKSVEDIYAHAFFNCQRLKTVDLGTKVRYIYYAAFRDTAISEITLPDSLTEIGHEAFSGCKLQKIRIPAKVNTIGIAGFNSFLAGNESLAEIEVDPGNTKFKVFGGALYEYNSQSDLKNNIPCRLVAYAPKHPDTKVTVLSGVKTIDTYTFAQVDETKSSPFSITELTLPNTLEAIEPYTINLPSLKSFTIPNSVTALEPYAVCCENLESLTIGTGLKEFSPHAFGEKGLPKLRSLTIASGNPNLCAIDSVIYNKACTKLLYYPPAKTDTVYHMPDTVQEVAVSGVANVSSLQEIFISGSLTKLPANSMSSNPNLKAVYFPGNAPGTSSASAFANSSEDLLIYITEGSTGWDKNGWQSMKYATWDPKDNAEKDGVLSGGISWKYESGIRRLTLSGTGQAMPNYAVNEEKPWQIFADDIQTVVTNNVSKIGSYTFYQAKNLRRVDADAALTEIGDYGFSKCPELLFFNNFTSLITVGKYGFSGDAKLESNLLLNKLTTMGIGAFQNCSSVSLATLGPNCTTLSNQGFSGCSGLNYLILPDSMMEIKMQACENCISLKSINIPATATWIEPKAFSNSGLLSAYFYGDVSENWYANMFEGCPSDLKLYYRTGAKGWPASGETWNGYMTLNLAKTYTENRDYYSFANNRTSFGYAPNYHIPLQRYMELLHNYAMAAYYSNVYHWDGSCFGMAASSLAFYLNGSFLISDYRPTGSLYAHPAPGKSALTEIIETYHLAQCLPIFAGAKGSVSRNRFKYDDLIKKVEEFERSGGCEGNPKADPVILSVYANYIGHTLIPVAVEVAANGEYQLKVYDCNKPWRLQTLTISSDMKSLSYSNGKYTEGSYISYSALEQGLKKALETSGPEEDDSVYISVNKEDFAPQDAEGNGLEDIEGAYEQKFMSAAEEGAEGEQGVEKADVFTGFRSFVLPSGTYVVSAEEATEEENAAEAPKEQSGDTGESLIYHVATEDVYASVTTTNQSAALNADVSETGGKVIELVSEEFVPEDMVAIQLMNAAGVERTVELKGSGVRLAIAEDGSGGENIVIGNLAESAVVVVDGKAADVIDGQVNTSFQAKEGDDTIKILQAGTDISCSEEGKLSGNVTAELVSMKQGENVVDIMASYVNGDGKTVAGYSFRQTLSYGRNDVSCPFENVETDFGEATGEVNLYLTLVVTDQANGKATYQSDEAHQVTAVKKENPGLEPGHDRPGTEDPGIEDPGTERPGGTGTGESGAGGTGTEESGAGGTGTGGTGTEESGAGGTGTGESGTEEPETGNPSSPTVSQLLAPQTVTLGVGETYQLKVQIKPAAASAAKLNYKVSGKCIRISKTGRLTAKKTGSAKVTITAGNVKKTVKVTVKKAPGKLTLNAKKRTMKKNTTFQIRPRLPRNTACATFKYYSNKKNVATVSSSGKVLAKKRGKAVITVKTYNGKQAKLAITVK